MAPKPPAAPNEGTVAGANWLCEVTGRPIPLHDCLECAEHRRVPVCPFPATVLKALANSMKSDDGLLEAQALTRRAGVALLRVTGLLGCVRQAWYAQRHPAPLQRPSEHWARLRGTIFHAALESLAGEPALAEQRLIASLEELGARAWIAGKIDHYDPTLRLATDYKTINTFGRRMAALDLPRQHHVAQLWIYGWLLEKSGHPYPEAGRIVYMDMGAVRTVDVPMPDAELQAAVEARLVEKARGITEAGPDGRPATPRRPGSAPTAPSQPGVRAN